MAGDLALETLAADLEALGLTPAIDARRRKVVTVLYTGRAAYPLELRLVDGGRGVMLHLPWLRMVAKERRPEVALALAHINGCQLTGKFVLDLSDGELVLCHFLTAAGGGPDQASIWVTTGVLAGMADQFLPLIDRLLWEPKVTAERLLRAELPDSFPRPSAPEPSGSDHAGPLRALREALECLEDGGEEGSEQEGAAD